MGLTCGLFRRRRADQPGQKPGRTRTFSIFGNSNQDSRGLLKQMVMATSLASPKPDMHQKAPMTDDSTTDSYDANPFPADETPLSLHVTDAVHRLYDALRGSEEHLSKAKFEVFLRETQGELNTELDRPHYSAGDFKFVMQYKWDAVGKVAEKDLSKSLANYFINSSHNTYLVGNQLASRSSPEAYSNVLSRGCRCIEIDVWNGDATAITNRSRSPQFSHRRGISGTSLPNVAHSVRDTAGDALETARSYFGDKASTHSRSPSTDSRLKEEDVSPRGSVTVFSESKESSDMLEVSSAARRRARTLSRTHIPQGEPLVTHGWTLTTPCGFREVCAAIRDSAFVENHLPVIISLEVHADPDQQRVMVDIMRETWGNMLVDQPFEGCDPKFRLPTLQDLKDKILVKVKRAPAVMTDPGKGSAPLGSADDSESESDETSRLAPSLSAPDPACHMPPQQKNVRVPICKELAELAVYTRSERFDGNFKSPPAKRPPHIFSISENRILDLHVKNESDLFMHNKSFLLRAFPAGRRIDSSNPDPSLFWRKGVQMVAMNWQYLDEGMMLNEGMFADEDGYVLKPASYQSANKTASTQNEATPGRTMDLSITIYAGQHIPAQSSDEEESKRSANTIRPVVKAELHVEKGVDASKDVLSQDCTYKMKTNAGKSDHPDFGPKGHTMVFSSIPRVVPELSFLRFKIEDDSRAGIGIMSSPMLAWSCIRLDRLRPGYRLVRLMDAKGCAVPDGKLLVKICIAYK